MEAQVDFTTRRYLADLIPPAEEPDEALEAESPVVAGVLQMPIAAGKGPDARMLLGSVAVSVWMIVATEIVVLVH